MSGRKLDLLPQKHFALVFGEAIAKKKFPRKRPFVLFGATLAAAAAVVVRYAQVSYPFSLREIWVARSLYAILGLHTMVWLLFRVFRLARKPGVSVAAQLLGSVCARLMLFLLALEVTCERTGKESLPLLAGCALAFAAVEITANALISVRVTNRIINGRYRPDGTAFWNSQKQMNLCWLLLAAPVCYAVAGLLKISSSLLERFTGFDASVPMNWLVVAGVWLLLASVAVIEAYRNVRQRVTLYCWRRFGGDADGYGFGHDVNDSEDLHNILPPCVFNEEVPTEEDILYEEEKRSMTEN